MTEFEFFTSPCGSAVTVYDGKKYIELSEKNTLIVKEVYEWIREKCPEAFERLNEIYSTNSNYRFLAVRRFIKCNWGAKDDKPDISTDNFNFEFVHCPLRGECIDEGIICKPQIETSLTGREIEIIKLLAQGLNNRLIGTRLFISSKTVENHVYNIMRKIGAHTRSAIVNHAHKNKII